MNSREGPLVGAQDLLRAFYNGMSRRYTHAVLCQCIPHSSSFPRVNRLVGPTRGAKPRSSTPAATTTSRHTGPVFVPLLGDPASGPIGPALCCHLSGGRLSDLPLAARWGNSTTARENSRRPVPTTEKTAGHLSIPRSV